MKKKTIMIGSVAGILLLILAIVFLGRYVGRKSGYSCYQIPFADGKLNWGMDTDEVIAVIGEPSSIEHREYGDVLTYDMALPCDFGDCVQAVFYIGIDNKAYADEKFSSGLKNVMFTVDNSSKDVILQEVSDFYGELSPEGGETLIEVQLSANNPDYFYQNHFCEEWRVETLPEDAFDRLQQVKNTATPDNQGIPIEKNARLMDVQFWGTDGYPCTVQLDADILTSYLHVEN